MEYSEFEKILLSQLKQNDKGCINYIECQINPVAITKPVHIKYFLNNLNDIILNNKDSFNLIEMVLKHNLFNDVLAEFRESDILINACKLENIPAIKWLMTMDISPYVQDENRMTALMHAAEHPKLQFVVEELIKDNNEYIHITDKNGETALFHAVDNPDILEKLIYCNIDINYQNNNNESVLLYCCKNNKEKAINKLVDKSSRINYDITDNEGRTAPMYLLDYEYLDTLFVVLKRKTFNINYYNTKNNESFVSLLVKKYQDMFINKKFYEIHCSKKDKITLYGSIFSMSITYPDCDFNVPIDNDGNTAIMYFMMIKDYIMTSFILSDNKNIDLSIKNKHGVSASLLSTFINKEEPYLIKAFLDHKTFDTQYTDKLNNNLLIYSVMSNNPNMFSKFVNEKSINHLNENKENAVIIASKLGFLENVSSYSIRNVNINQQDYLGNTAMYYAIKLKDKYAINLLAYNNADINIKNNEGVSANDLVQELNEKDIIKILNKPIPAHEMKKKLENSNKSFLFMKKKKNTDEKLEEYIKNYQINNYQDVYNTIIKSVCTYEEAKRNVLFEKKLALALYTTVCPRKTFIPLIRINPQKMIDNRYMAGVIAAAVVL